MVALIDKKLHQYREIGFILGDGVPEMVSLIETKRAGGESVVISLPVVRRGRWMQGPLLGPQPAIEAPSIIRPDKRKRHNALIQKAATSKTPFFVRVTIFLIFIFLSLSFLPYLFVIIMQMFQYASLRDSLKVCDETCYLIDT